MHEIPILQYMSVQVGREFILDALELRLHPDAALAFKPLLETIEDPQRIKQLFHAAIQVDSVEDFQKVLGSEQRLSHRVRSSQPRHLALKKAVEDLRIGRWTDLCTASESMAAERKPSAS